MFRSSDLLFLIGNNGRNTTIGFGLRDIDLSLHKSVPIRKITEEFRVQF